MRHEYTPAGTKKAGRVLKHGRPQTGVMAVKA
jgi:hypothetical protein